MHASHNQKTQADTGDLISVSPGWCGLWGLVVPLFVITPGQDLT